MTVTLGTLQREHAQIHQTLKVMQTQLNLMRSGDVVDLRVLCEVTDFLGAFLTTVHHPNEEMVLAQLALQAPSVEDAIWLLTDEHRQCEDQLIALIETLAHGRCERCGSEERLHTQLEELIDRQRIFMHLEERTLFPMIGRALVNRPLTPRDSVDARPSFQAQDNRVERRLFGG